MSSLSSNPHHKSRGICIALLTASSWAIDSNAAPSCTVSQFQAEPPSQNTASASLDSRGHWTLEAREGFSATSYHTCLIHASHLHLGASEKRT